MSYLLFNPELAQIIRDETSAAFASDIVDYNIIESSRVLRGAWLEMLRLSTSPLTIRHITEDFEMKGLRLRRGGLAILNPRPLHINSDYFGANPLDFDAKRFIDNPGYERHPAFRPFGGGEACCSGRHKAKQSALTFVACLLHEYDIELAWAQKFPKPSLKTYPGVSVVAPAEGVDLFVRLTENSRKR